MLCDLLGLIPFGSDPIVEREGAVPISVFPATGSLPRTLVVVSWMAFSPRRYNLGAWMLLLPRGGGFSASAYLPRPLGDSLYLLELGCGPFHVGHCKGAHHLFC